ncbi:MAG: hypothetical protein PHR35_22170 [Kiritimatiellae bacterium]|nr:hypothetical protein [Kiritimatiellia bacterium]
MTPWKRADTDWFHQACWGTFIHYLAETASSTEAITMTPDEWNRRVDSFDVDRYAVTLAEIGCGYTFLTLGQCSGFFCSPNDTYDRIVGVRPSRLSRRDLPGDLADALKKVGIPLMVYVGAHAPSHHREAVEALRFTPSWDPSRWSLRPGAYLQTVPVDDRLSEAQRNWEAVIREWSLRWGDKVRGWWVDGCFYADRMYRHEDEPNFRSFASALKAGNADSLVAFNPGVHNPVVSMTEYEDYTAGEISNTLPTTGEEPCVIPVGRWVKGAQYHFLTFLAGNWGRGEPRFTDAMVAAYTAYVNSWGGVITWDHPVTPDGRIPDAFLRQLKGLRA